MPEPVSCREKPGSPVVECDPVRIGPEPDLPSEVEAPPSGGERGVRSLVDGQTPALRVLEEETVEVDVPLPVGELVRKCATDALGTALVIGNAQTQAPLNVGFSVLRSALDLALCVEETIDDATQRARAERAVEMCKEKGGEPIGFVLESLTCEKLPERPSR